METRKPFHVHVDEAHRFTTTDSLEDLIAETRKYNVSLTLAHQFFSQFGTKKIDALSSVGTTIIMNVDGKDARYLTKDLRDLVKPEDLMKLEVGEAIIRVGTEVVRGRTPDPLSIPRQHFRDRIIKESRKRYYKPAHVVRKLIEQRNNRWERPFSPLQPSPSGPVKELIYDEFR